MVEINPTRDRRPPAEVSYPPTRVDPKPTPRPTPGTTVPSAPQRKHAPRPDLGRKIPAPLRNSVALREVLGSRPREQDSIMREVGTAYRSLMRTAVQIERDDGVPVREQNGQEIFQAAIQYLMSRTPLEEDEAGWVADEITGMILRPELMPKSAHPDI